MFTIIYNKDGDVINIVAGESNYEHLLELDNDFIYVNELPKYDMYRQVLKVIDKELKVVNLEITPEREMVIRGIEIRGEISYHKSLLAETDYKTLKYVDGAISEEQYAIIRAERQNWRNTINRLEIELSKIGQ
jgi:hypothetical protein